MALYFQEITDKIVQRFFENICQADVSLYNLRLLPEVVFYRWC